MFLETKEYYGVSNQNKQLYQIMSLL